LLCILFLFFTISPFLLELVPKAIGYFSFAVIICLLLLKRFNRSYIKIILSVSFYFLGIYYIFFTEYSQNSIYITFQYRHYYNILFFVLGMFYIGHLISTSEKISVTPNDFLMFTVVIFLFFLPKDYPWTLHVRAIAVKSFLIFICMELILKRLKTKIDSTLTPAILALGLNSFISFFPFIM